MIELLRDKVFHLKTNIEKYNFLREYFQLLILKIIDEQGFFRHITFMGGTALRILYDLERFSEDLDFNVLPGKRMDFIKTMNKLKQELNLMGLNVETTCKNHKTVAVASIKFNSILYPLGVSALRNQNIMIKFEVDKNPPEGFQTEFSLINKEFLLNITHLDKPSLFSGKLHALFCRKYIKGRDYYDLMWFLTKKIKPNLEYLNAGLTQQNQQIQCGDLNSVKLLLQEKFEKTDFNAVLKDLQPFLLDQKQARFFNKAMFQEFLEKLDW